LPTLAAKVFGVDTDFDPRVAITGAESIGWTMTVNSGMESAQVSGMINALNESEGTTVQVTINLSCTATGGLQEHFPFTSQ
jgi:hypothetical protein